VGASVTHVDFDEDEDSVMEPYSTLTNYVQHEITPITQQIVNYMKDFDQSPPNECDCDSGDEPEMGHEKTEPSGNASDKAASVSDFRLHPKPKKTMTKRKRKRRSLILAKYKDSRKLVSRDLNEDHPANV